MAISGAGLHHYHVRQRIHVKHEPYPHPDFMKRMMDRLVYFAGIFGPIVTFPQLVKIYVEKDASGLSLLSWIGYLMGAGFWLTYAIMHKEKPLIITYGSWVILHTIIIIGIILYGEYPLL